MILTRSYSGVSQYFDRVQLLNLWDIDADEVKLFFTKKSQLCLVMISAFSQAEQLIHSFEASSRVFIHFALIQRVASLSAKSKDTKTIAMLKPIKRLSGYNNKKNAA